MTPTADESSAIANLAQAFMAFLLAHEEAGACRADRRRRDDNARRSDSTPTRPLPPERFLLPVKDAAKFLSVSVKTLWKLTAPRGPLPSVHFGRTARYPIDDLKAAILGMRTKSMDTPADSGTECVADLTAHRAPQVAPLVTLRNDHGHHRLG